MFKLKKIREINTLKIMTTFEGATNTVSRVKNNIHLGEDLAPKINILTPLVHEDTFEVIYVDQQLLGSKAKKTKNTFNLYTVFEAETSGGLAIDVKIDTGSSKGWSPGTTVSTVANLIGIAPALDYSRKMTYAGTQPFSFTVKCFLTLRNSVDEDFIQPLRRLFAIALPTRGYDITEALNPAYEGAMSLWDNNAPDFLKKVVAKVKGFITLAGGGEYAGEYAQDNGATLEHKTGGTLKDKIGSVYLISVPPSYRITQNLENRLVIKLGQVRIEEVVIKSIQLSLPTLLYDEGYPDHIKVDIAFETLRCATYNNMANLIVAPKTEK